MTAYFKEQFGISMEQLSRITEIPYENIYNIMSGSVDAETYSQDELELIEKTLDITSEEMCSYIVKVNELKRSTTIFSDDDSDSVCTGYVYVEDSCLYLGLNVSDDQYDFCLCGASGENAVSVCSSMDEIFEYYVDQVTEIYS